MHTKKKKHRATGRDFEKVIKKGKRQKKEGKIEKKRKK